VVLVIITAASYFCCNLSCQQINISIRLTDVEGLRATLF